MSLEQFFQDNFVIPLGQYYTPVNTIIYGVFFALAVFGIYKLLRKWNIDIDKKFAVGIVPFVVLGSVLRVLRDAGTLDYFIFASPLIYMLIFLIALIALLISVGVEKWANKVREKSWLREVLSSYNRLWSGDSY